MRQCVHAVVTKLNLGNVSVQPKSTCFLTEPPIVSRLNISACLGKDTISCPHYEEELTSEL